MDIIGLLKRDHRNVKGLFQEFEKGSGKVQKQKIAERIIEELSLHASIEEQLVYPLLRARDTKSKDRVLEALEEHHLAKTTLAELDAMTTADERYDAKMTVLAESIRHHIEEEESQVLPRFQRATTEEERKQLADAVPHLKEMAPNHPHPMAPDAPPGNAVAGLLAKILDVGKDASRLIMGSTKGKARQAVKASRRRAESGKSSGRGRRLHGKPRPVRVVGTSIVA